MWIPDSFSAPMGPSDATHSRQIGNGFGPPSQTRSLDVVVSRGGLVESVHRVHAAVVSSDGRLIDASRDPELSVWWRSCAKPFQVMPLLRSGGFDHFGWEVEELALACASHGGEPEHVAIAQRMLERLGLEEGDLACGPHDPLASRGLRVVRESGQRLTRLHNNCSGKHAAMLARAVQTGIPTAGYERPHHAVQQDCLVAVSEWAGIAAASIGVGVDGCGVSVFALPLANMALSYARLVRAAAEGDGPSRRVVSAMTGHPFLVGGTDRFDTLLMQACQGNVVCKIGAEGVHTFAIVDRGIGFAIKVEDGSPRAQYPVVLALLAAYDALPSTMPEALREYVQRPVRNTRGETVGVIRVGHLDVGDRLEFRT